MPARLAGVPLVYGDLFGVKERQATLDLHA
jgi:hypothetical protein